MPRDLAGLPHGMPGSDTLIVCLSHLRWDFVWQRPQHLMTRAARDAAVLFCEEPVLGEDVPAPRLDCRSVARNITVGLPILPQSMPAHEHGPAIRALLHTHLAQRRPARQVHWFYTPMAMAFAADLPADVIVHDCMDELSAFDGAPPQLPVFERALLRRADLVFTGGRSLFRARQSRHPDLHLFPSSVDIDHFRPARDGLADLPAQRDLPRPRIGFFGVIDERMDVELLDRVAERRPEWQFVMAGPVVKIDPAILPRRPNIAWLGPIAYGALPALLANWDVGLMPFALNRATRFISPTKTLEYMAAGVPLVSTPIADVVSPYGDHGLVEIASDPLATIAALERTLAHDRAAWLQAADAYLATTSWDRTWARMHGLIEQRLAARARGALCQRGGGAELAPAIAAAAQHA